MLTSGFKVLGQDPLIPPALLQAEIPLVRPTLALALRQ